MEFVEDLKIDKTVVEEFVLEIVRKLFERRKILLCQAFETWNNELRQDFGIRTWIVLLRETVKKIKNWLRTKGKFLTSNGFLMWKERTAEGKIREAHMKEIDDYESRFQTEIKDLEIKINELQIKNDELSKLHGHFVNRETIFCTKIAELKRTKKEPRFEHDLPEKTLNLQEENYELEFKLHASEFILKEFLKSSKLYITDSSD